MADFPPYHLISLTHLPSISSTGQFRSTILSELEMPLLKLLHICLSIHYPILVPGTSSSLAKPILVQRQGKATSLDSHHRPGMGRRSSTCAKKLTIRRSRLMACGHVMSPFVSRLSSGMWRGWARRRGHIRRRSSMQVSSAAIPACCVLVLTFSTLSGSYFNIYVQTLKKKDKGVQLGIYLHRQSMLEPLPAASKPRAGATRASSPLGWNASLPALNQAHPPGGTPATALGMQRTMSIPTMTTAMLSTSPPSQVMMNEDEMPAEENMSTSPASPKSPPLNRNAPMSPYRDPRKVARVYFSVSCASAMGTALTRFSSGPDQFAVSQSWGWRSSSLRSQEYLAGSGPENHGPSLNERLESGVLGWISDVDEDWSKKNLHSLRASVVLGVLFS